MVKIIRIRNSVIQILVWGVRNFDLYNVYVEFTVNVKAKCLFYTLTLKTDTKLTLRDYAEAQLLHLD